MCLKLFSISEKPSKSIFPLINELHCVFELAHTITMLFKFLKLPSPEMILQTRRFWYSTCLTALTPEMTQ
jgi:hypothetical protein